MHTELDLVITKVMQCRKAHKCDFCGNIITTGSSYFKLTVRFKNDRFPHDKRICCTHKINTIPIGVLLNERA